MTHFVDSDLNHINRVNTPITILCDANQNNCKYLLVRPNMILEREAQLNKDIQVKMVIFILSYRILALKQRRAKYI